MWLAKYKIWHKNCILRPRCIKYKITDFVWLINSWDDAEYFYYTEMHVLQGSAENKRRFIADLQKDPGIHKIEISGNHFFTLNKEPLKKQYYHPIFDQRIIQPRPTVQRSDGFEDWELACWKREPLTRITEVPVFDVTIQSIQEIPITDVFFPTLYPKLSEKQREAVETAVAHGYYDHPRGAYLADLAKHTKTTRQNFQEHLRKAERKIMPFLSENVLH